MRGDPAEAEFWSAVDNADLESLSSNLWTFGETRCPPSYRPCRRGGAKRHSGPRPTPGYEVTWSPLAMPAGGAPASRWLGIAAARWSEDCWVAAVVASLGPDTSIVEGG